MADAHRTLSEDHLREWIGRQETAVDIVSLELVRKFNATFDLQADPCSGSPVPRLLHYCLAQAIGSTASLGEDGHPQRGAFLPPVPLPRRMWAGSSLFFEDEIRIGEEVRRASRIADVSVKAGRSGTLCFVVVEHMLHAGDRYALRERQEIVYRGGEAIPGTPRAPRPAPGGAHQRRVRVSPTFLFRYSALTFNGHRIHYDRDYATGVEGYPGLVVHGPLQATLLMNFAADIYGRPPSSFSFRSHSPLFEGVLVLHADEGEAGLKLWTATENGPIAMAAEANWL